MEAVRTLAVKHVTRKRATQHMIFLVVIMIIEVGSLLAVEALWWHLTLAVTLFGKDVGDTVLDAVAEVWER